jgi:hypothetical protein
MQTNTYFASLEHYQKGDVQIIDDDVKNYVFSNLFEVAKKMPAFQRTAVAKNFRYIIECMRVEGDSPWFIANHDEFVLAMDGNIKVEYINSNTLPALPNEGALELSQKPEGKSMGYIQLKRGHMALLPPYCAYRFSSVAPAVLIIQTIQGPSTVECWEEICQQS